MKQVEHKIAEELYDIIAHCRSDNLENFIEDLLNFLNEWGEQTNDK